MMDLSAQMDRLEAADLAPCCGRVTRLAGLTIESSGPPIAVGGLCDIRLVGGRQVAAEVVGFHDSRRVLMPLETIEGICPGDLVVPRRRPRRVPVGDGLLGRVLNGLGEPIDDLGPLRPSGYRSLQAEPPAPLSRPMITEPLPLGLRSFDGLLTCGKGQRVGIFAGAGVGKSTLLGEIARSSDAQVNVLALVGERGREVRQFLEESLGPEGLARSVVCVATADTPAIQRVKLPLMAITIAEAFRDAGCDVLLMLDSLTRFAHAQREIGLAAGEPPTTRGYCPSVFSLLPRLTERLGSARTGSITGIFTILVEGDDMNDPVADSVRSLLDGHFVLSRRLAEMGQYPAVDILQSVSRLMTAIASPEHLQAARRFRAICSTWQRAEDLINIGAYVAGSNPRIDKAVELIEPIHAFLRQGLNERAPFSETIERMVRLTASWTFDDQPAEWQDETGA